MKPTKSGDIKMITFYRILILGLLLMAGTASTITCLGDYTETYTDTVTRAVGPTTLTGARGTFPQPSPTDVNSIHVAVNGNDTTGTGVAANPVATIGKAISLLGGGFTNVQIIRFGYVGDLIFTLTATETLPTNATMQVADGEIAYIRTDSIIHRFVAGGGTTINGIDFASGTVLLSVGQSNNVSCTFQNCRFIVVGPGTSGTMVTTMEYCDSIGLVGFSTGTAWTLNLDHTILRNSGLLGSSFGPGVVRWSVSASSPASITINLDHAYILWSTFVEVQFASGSSDVTVNINADDSAYIGATTLVNSLAADAASSALTASATVVNDFCLNTAINTAMSYVWLDGYQALSLGTISLTETNSIEPSTAILLRNLSGATQIFGDIQAGDLNGSRLQLRGALTPNGQGTYFFDSPLATADSSGGALNPWDETITGPVRTYESEFTFEMAPASHSIEPEFVGNVEVAELNGGTSQDFDALRRVWKIVWPDSNRDALNNDWKRIQALLWDKGRKKVYLRGTDGNWLDGFATQAVLDTSDTLDDVVDGSLALVNPTSPGTIAWNWRNWWIEVTDGSVTYEYWVYTSDGDSAAGGTKLYIIDKLGMGFPADGTYEVAVRYFLASLRLEGQPLIFSQHIVGFTAGQRYAEGFSLGSVEPTTDQERFQGKGFTLLLVEQTDPKAGPANPA